MSYQQFLGIPFRFRGRDLEGTDCLGLVWMYLRSRGVRIPDGDGLPMEKDLQPDYLDRAVEALSKLFESVAYPQADDIILMRLPGGYTHMGVMVDDDNMLHVLKDRPSAIEPVLKYKRRVVGIFRPKVWRLFGPKSATPPVRLPRPEGRPLRASFPRSDPPKQLAGGPGDLQRNRL